MKLIKQVSNFAPFDITLRIETEGEARALYHVLNNSSLDKVIKGEVTYYSLCGYNKDIGTLDCREAREFIKSRVDVSQGGD